MSKINDGGSAFPYSALGPDGSLHMYADSEGMTLRDYFAAKALVSLISSASKSVDLGCGFPENNLNFAMAAYAVADAMLTVRSQP